MAKKKGSKPSMMITFSMLIIIGFVVVCGFVFAGSKVMAKYERFSEGHEVLKAKQAELATVLDDTEAFKKKQLRFQNDTDFLTEVAHQQGMVGPDEFLIEFKGDQRDHLGD